MPKFKQIDTSKVKTYSIEERKSKIVSSDFAGPHQPGNSFQHFLDNIPDILKAQDFRRLVDIIVNANMQNKPIIILMGAHVIKVGLNPLLVDAMHQGIITGLAMNGAGAVHDLELAYWGRTSEDVAEGLKDGSFGMAKETGKIINTTISRQINSGSGFGEIIGKRIYKESPPYSKYSLLASGFELDIPVTVHVAIGTDIVHQHPNVDAFSIGEASYRDFRVLAQNLTEIGNGGVVLLFGSSVILPEVFLKALTMVRNLGYPAHKFTTANFDMISHYRPRMNVLQRPALTGGHGFEFIGHHEIMIPLLFAAVKEKVNS